MTFLQLAFGALLSLAVGFALADILLFQVRTHSWLKAWVGVGLGLGVTSLTYFAWRLWAQADGSVYLLLELVGAVLIALTGLVLRQRRQPIDLLQSSSPQAQLPIGWHLFLNGALVVSIVFAGLTYLFGTLVFPYGRWDAMGIWNLAARILFLGDTNWQTIFNMSVYHPDYPLLVGSSVARLWTYRSVVDFLAPAMVGLLFFAATLGLLYTLANITRGWISARLAGLALLGSSTILVIAPTQHADLPLGYYLLGALGCLVLHSKAPKSGFLMTAGVLLGMGIWTKNEGWLLAIAVFVAWFTTMIFYKRRSLSLQIRLREAGLFISGMIPFAFFSLYQKILLAPPNDLIAGQGGEILARISDPARWLEISRRIGIQILSLDSVPFAMLIVLVLVFGLREKAFSQPAVWINMVTLAVVLSGYFLVYLTTPHDQVWHLRTSLSRLFAQLWPAAVFTMILLIRLPGETHHA